MKSYDCVDNQLLCIHAEPVVPKYCGCYEDRYTDGLVKPKPGPGVGITDAMKEDWFKDSARWGVWSGAFEIENNVMTIEHCRDFAVKYRSQNGYPPGSQFYYGLQYGQE
jgi:hypothetical protein